MQAPESDRGAPIVGPDNIVESGNGRVSAIKMAADQFPAKYAAYVKALQDAGHNTDGIDTPILVGARQTPLTDPERVAFTQENNSSATAALSATEQAKVDSGNLSSDLLAKFDPTQDPTSAANRGFVQSWVATLPEAERNGVQDEKGNLSADGVRRLNGAMLARAYDDTGVLARGLESTDDATRSVSGALADAAPVWAKLRAGVEDARVPAEFDTSKQLVNATDIVRAAREKKQTLSDILNQQDAFNPIDPVTAQYVRALYNPEGTRAASRASISDTLRRYAAEASNQSTEKGLFGDEGKVTPQTALEAIVSRRGGTAGPEQTSLLSGNGTGLRTAAGGSHGDLIGDLVSDQAHGDAATRTALPGKREPRDFNANTSPYRQVFTDAGRDPDLMVNRPLPEQNKIIAGQMKAKFGFKNVEVSDKQNPREVRDQLSNFYHNAGEMASALGMPHEAIGLHNRVTFTTMPFGKRTPFLGTYAPGSRTITIPGRSNSFAHEWTHALDHYLADALPNNPKAMRMLSEIKGMSLDAPTLGGKPVVPDSPAEAFVGVLHAMFGKDASTAAESLRANFDARGQDPIKAHKAALRLDQIETDFAKNARTRTGKQSPYYMRPIEMLARAHEAYVSDAIQRAGGDTRAIAKPFYEGLPGASTPEPFERLYPQQAERDKIFMAFTELHDRLRAESILGTGTAPRPGDLGMVDPSKWGKMSAPPGTPTTPPGLRGALQREIQAQKNWRSKFLSNLMGDGKAAEPGALSVGTRALDGIRVATNSMRDRMNVLAERQPTPVAKAAFQGLIDKITPAEGLRSKSDAAGRQVGQVFEQEVRQRSRQDNAAFENILRDHGLTEMTPMEDLMLRHVLTEGDKHTFVPPGETKAFPVRDNVKLAGGKLRYLLDTVNDRNISSGVDVGYKAGYFPRQYDTNKIFNDRAGFQSKVSELHKGMFDKAVGDDPSKLLAAYDAMHSDDQARAAAADPDLEARVKALRANLAKQDHIQTALDEGTHANPAQARADLDRLRAEAGDLHDQLKDPLGDAHSQGEASRWWLHEVAGGPAEFDRRGPNASYTRERVLPPEADKLLRDYMHTDIASVLPHYFQQSARKVAYTKRFGQSGGEIDNAMDMAADNGSRPEDIASLRRLIEVSTGKLPSTTAVPLENALNTVHALGTMALMPRAIFSSLTEPAALLARGGTLGDTMGAFAKQIGQAFGTAKGKERAELARLVGVTTSHFYDTMMADRSNAEYRDSPKLSRWMTNYYRTTGLTQLTNSQRAAVLGTGHEMLSRFGQDLTGKNARYAKEAAAQFRDYGIADKDHQAFADWLAQAKGLPNAADLETSGGRLWGQAIGSMVDKHIQDPLKVDKPELATSNPLARMAYGLMGFTYSYWHNIIEHVIGTNKVRVQEAFGGARAAGRGRIMSAAASAPAAARAAGTVGAYGAATIAGSYLTTALRTYLTDPATWEKHEEDGNLHDWLLDRAISQSGINGPLDPVVQAVTGLKYERDLSGLFAGAQAGFFLQNAGDVLKWWAGMGAPDTNTSRFNGIRGLYSAAGMPAAMLALSSLPGGPFARAVVGAAMMRMSTRGAAEKVAEHFVGPKGTKIGGGPPVARDPNAAPPPPSAGGGGPVGLLDDVAAPALRVGLPLWERLPRVGKIAAGVAAGLGVAAHLHSDFRQFKPQE